MSSAQRHFLLALAVACFLFCLVVIIAPSLARDPLLQVEGGSYDLPTRILADSPRQGSNGA